MQFFAVEQGSRTQIDWKSIVQEKTLSAACENKRGICEPNKVVKATIYTIKNPFSFLICLKMKQLDIK